MEKYWDDLLTDRHLRQEIEAHLQDCQFCQESGVEYQAWKKELDSVTDTPLTEEETQLAEKLYLSALKGQIIALKPLVEKSVRAEYYLAADGKKDRVPPIVNLATLYSDNPEIILKLMRDNDTKNDYLQLLASHEELIDGVMVCVSEKNWEFVTDNSGKAEIPAGQLDDLSALNWQIKMPDAVFSLEPLKYDPDKVEYAKDEVLETDRGDKIRVLFEGKTSGKQITIEILALDGKAEFGQVKVGVSLEQETIIKPVKASQKATFDISGKGNKIKIRLFS